MENIFRININKRNYYETIAVLSVAILFIAYYKKIPESYYLYVSVFFVITLFVPVLIFPVTWALLFIGKVLSNIVPYIVLTLFFFLILTPIGLIRSAFGFDSLKLKQFKKEDSSVFIANERDLEFQDIVKPY